MRRRENTFRIDYAHVPRKPSYEELHEFVNSVLELQREQVIRIQPSRSLQCAFVKVSELSLAQNIVEKHDNKHDTEVDGKTYKIRIRMEDGAVDVKLFDLSEDVTDEAIVDFLRAYGEVLSIRELMWDEKYTFGGIPTGVREVKMMIKENIPSYVVIDGETTALSYYGQQQTCRHCNEFVHSGISCVQNKKLLVQKLDSDQSYANIVKQQSKPKTHRTFPTRLVAKPTNTQNQADTASPSNIQQQTETTKLSTARKPPTQPKAAEPGSTQSNSRDFKIPNRPIQAEEPTRKITTT